MMKEIGYAAIWVSVVAAVIAVGYIRGVPQPATMGNADDLEVRCTYQPQQADCILLP